MYVIEYWLGQFRASQVSRFFGMSAESVNEAQTEPIGFITYPLHAILNYIIPAV